MPNDLPCTVSWCDHDCRWEYETDGLPTVQTVAEFLAEADYLTGFGHPPFRWHSRLWPSGVCLEQNEFPPDTDPRYVAEHGRLIIRGTNGPARPDPCWTKTDLARVTQLAAVTAQLAVDLAEAAALAGAAPDRVDSTARIGRIG